MFHIPERRRSNPEFPCTRWVWDPWTCPWPPQSPGCPWPWTWPRPPWCPSAGPPGACTWPARWGTGRDQRRARRRSPPRPSPVNWGRRHSSSPGLGPRTSASDRGRWRGHCSHWRRPPGRGRFQHRNLTWRTTFKINHDIRGKWYLSSDPHFSKFPWHTLLHRCRDDQTSASWLWWYPLAVRPSPQQNLRRFS